MQSVFSPLQSVFSPLASSLPSSSPRSERLPSPFPSRHLFFVFSSRSSPSLALRPERPDRDTNGLAAWCARGIVRSGRDELGRAQVIAEEGASRRLRPVAATGVLRR